MVSRTENDVRELREIIREFDFIKHSEYNFQPADLSELVKSAQVVELKPLTPLYKSGDDADYMCFVI